MNWLFLLESTLAGVISGLISAFFADSIDSWNILYDFKSSLFVETIFCGCFCGFAYSFQYLVAEKFPKKIFNRFLTSASLGALMGSIGVTVFRLVVDYTYSGSNFEGSSGKFFMWVIPAISLSLAWGAISGGLRSIVKSFMSFTPVFVIVGFIINRISANISKETIFVLIGLISGFGFGIIWDFLKTSWLDEEYNKYFVFRYYLDGDSFWIGSSYDCDLTVKRGEELMMQINEKDGVHILEVEENSEVVVNNVKAKYRILQEGDKITASERTLVYHTNLMRVRDTVPNEMAGI